MTLPCAFKRNASEHAEKLEAHGCSPLLEAQVHSFVSGLYHVQLWDFDFEGALPYASESAAFEHLEKHVENYKPPACFPLLEATMVCQIRVNRGQMFRDHVLPLIKRMAKPTDIAVMNFA